METVLNQDCLMAVSELPDETFDLIVSDPPYMEYKTSHRKDKADKLSQNILYQDREEQIATIHQCIRVLKQDSAMYLFTNWMNIWWMQQPFESMIRNMIVWNKGNWTAGDLYGSFGNKYEVILLLSKGKWKYEGARESDIWEIPRMGTTRIHPTQKPVSLYEKIILNSSKEGDLILDPYLGSGASVIAALKTNRNILGYELDKEFYIRVQDRINSFRKNGVDCAET